MLLGSNCQLAHAAWPRVKVDPGSTHALNTDGTRFFSSAEGSYLYKQPTNLLQPCLSVGILCQVSFRLSVSYDWLSCTAILMTKLATVHCQLTTDSVLLYGANTEQTTTSFFFCKVTVSSPIFSNDLLVVCQLTIFHDVPVSNSSVKTVSGTLKKTL